MWALLLLALSQSPVEELPDAGVVEALAPIDDVPDAGPSRETVIVGTPERKVAGSAHTINGARLKRYELDDPHAVLQAVPGVQVRGEDGFGLRPNIGLRGANPDRTKKVTLLEDGVLFGPAPYSAPAAYYFPLITRMEAVQVMKGPASILYGPQTVGGAIDFITRDLGPGLGAGLDVAYGSYNYGKGHGWFSVGNDTTMFLLEGVHLRSDGFKQLDVVGGNTGFQRNEWMMKGRHVVTLGEFKNTFTLKLGISTEESNETYLGLTDADFRENGLRRYVASEFDHMGWQRTQVTLTHKLESDAFTLTTNVYRHDFHRVWRKVNHFGGAAIDQVLAAPNSVRNQVYAGILRGEVDSSGGLDTLYIGPNRRDFVSQGIESVFRTKFMTGPLSHALEVRGRFHYDSIARLHTEDGYLMRAGQLVATGEPTLTTAWNFDETYAVALSATDVIGWNRFTLTPGVRVELINSSSTDKLANTYSTGSANVVLPGIGAHVALTDSLGVLGGVYRGFSPPPPGVQGGLPELAMNVEAGARWARGGSERVELIGFFNDYANLTTLCTESSGCVTSNLDKQFNAGRALIYGVEAFAEKKWRFGSVTLPTSVAYTYMNSQLMSSFHSDDPSLGNVTAGDELPYVPHHLLNASAGIDVWRISAHAQFSLIDRMREQAGQGALVPGLTTDLQAVLDVHLGVTLTSWAQLTFDVRNVTDNRAIVGRRPFGARPNAPRTFIGGLKLTY